jgi:hypothetical protein
MKNEKILEAECFAIANSKKCCLIKKIMNWKKRRDTDGIHIQFK